MVAWRVGTSDGLRAGPPIPVMIALAETVARYRIPIAAVRCADFGFRARSNRRGIPHVRAVTSTACARFANWWGTWSCTRIAAHSLPENTRATADATCTALQLANFWQDVARDLAIGRIYLPREDRTRFGYAETDLRDRRFTPAFANLMKFEIDRTRVLFERGRSLVSRITGPLAVDIDLFTRGGLAILERIEARGFDVLGTRPSLTRWTKLKLLLGAIAAMGVSRIRPRVPSTPTEGAAHRMRQVGDRADRVPSELTAGPCAGENQG